MVKDGIILGGALVLAGVLLGHYVEPRLALPLFVFAGFFLFFFRDPNRKVPDGDVIVAPADGSVALIRPLGDHHTRISIFLSVFDVHVNRSPVAGTIAAVDYRKGKFVNAMNPSASDENERNRVEVKADNGSTVVFSQIAGLLARRIVFSPKVGDRVEKGQRIGMIKFGSRTDVILGPEWTVEAKPNQNVIAGVSVLARRSAAALVRSDSDRLANDTSAGSQEDQS